MNINSIQKHYDKLDTTERFKLLNAARSRGDESELTTLRNSAPKKTWSVTTTTGIVNAFDFLAAWHIMTMLELESVYWVLIALGDDPDNIKMPGDNTWSGMLDNIQRRALGRDEAWRAVCKEYNLDPDEMIEVYPGVVSIGYFLRTLREWQTIRPVKYDTTPYIADLRAVIDIKRKEWE